MMSKFFTIVSISIFFASLLVLHPIPAQAQTIQWSGVCVGQGPNTDVATVQGLECLIANVFIVIITLIGLVGFVMFIFGALKWMLSGSDTQGIKKASSTMLYSVVGLVVALSAFIIISLIADFTGVNVIRYFRIPESTRGIAGVKCREISGADCRDQAVCGANYGNMDCGQLFCCKPR